MRRPLRVAGILATTLALAALTANAFASSRSSQRRLGNDTPFPVRTFFFTADVGQNVTLAHDGPFTFTGKCVGPEAPRAPANTTATPYVRTSQDGAHYSDYGDSGPEGNQVLNVSTGDKRIQW